MKTTRRGLCKENRLLYARLMEELPLTEREKKMANVSECDCLEPVR